MLLSLSDLMFCLSNLMSVYKMQFLVVLKFEPGSLCLARLTIVFSFLSVGFIAQYPISSVDIIYVHTFICFSLQAFEPEVYSPALTNFGLCK